MQPDHSVYVPILKWKRAEIRALMESTDEVKAGILPLFEVPPIDIDFATEEPRKTPAEHVRGIPSSIQESWGGDRPFFLDLNLVYREEADSHDRLLTDVHEELRALNLQAIPVISVRSSDPARVAIRAICSYTDDLCLRIRPRDAQNRREAFTRIDDTLASVGVSAENVHLLLDLEELGDSAGALQFTPILNALCEGGRNWKTLTISSTSSPADLSGMPQTSISFIERREWGFWRDLFQDFQDSSLIRMPRFGDYTITHPTYLAIDPRQMHPSGNIRYTLEQEFMIIKGLPIRDRRRDGVVTQGHGFAQMMDLCRTLINRSEFTGADFSAGDQYIWDCANGRVSTGNPERWKFVGVNHHLAVAVSALSNFLSNGRP